jgi:hypothetical protein
MQSYKESMMNNAIYPKAIKERMAIVITMKAATISSQPIVAYSPIYL